MPRASAGFKVGGAEGAEALAQCDCAGKPRWAVFALTLFHKAKVKLDCGRRDFSQRGGRQLVTVPNTTGEKAIFATHRGLPRRVRAECLTDNSHHRFLSLDQNC